MELRAIQTFPGIEVRCQLKAKARPEGRRTKGGNECLGKREALGNVTAPSPHGPTTNSRRPWVAELLCRPKRPSSSGTVRSKEAEQRAPVDLAVHDTPAAVGRALGPAGDSLPCRAPELEPRPVHDSVFLHVIVTQILASWHVLSLAVSPPPCCRRMAPRSTVITYNFLHIMSVRWYHSNSLNISYRRARGLLHSSRLRNWL